MLVVWLVVLFGVITTSFVFDVTVGRLGVGFVVTTFLIVALFVLTTGCSLGLSSPITTTVSHSRLFWLTKSTSTEPS